MPVIKYPPLDSADPVGRFLDHWQPDAAIFVESEIWPRLIVETAKRGTPLALLNARLSDKSVVGWTKRPKTARFILNHFNLFLTQNDKTATNLIAMGAPPEKVQRGTNLKAMSDPLPVDAEALSKTREQIDNRPVWIASSTHPGEEETVLAAHVALLKRWPDLLLLLIPRHPERRNELTKLTEGEGLTLAPTQRRPTDNSTNASLHGRYARRTGNLVYPLPDCLPRRLAEKNRRSQPFEPARPVLPLSRAPVTSISPKPSPP